MCKNNNGRYVKECIKYIKGGITCEVIRNKDRNIQC